MAFTWEQQAKLIAAVDAKANVKLCPGCGTRSWQLGPGLTFLQISTPGNPLAPGGAYPCVVLICRTCGNTQLYNVYILGVEDIVGVGPPIGDT